MTVARTVESLNGWWDFRPDLSEAGKGFRPPPESIPADSWLGGSVIVPGSWTRGGVEYDADELAERPWMAGRLYDNFSYPAAWDAMRTAWYRRSFRVESLSDSKRLELRFGGVLRYAWYYVNGVCVGRSTDGTMPSRHDVTHAVREGENELCVYVTDYERNEKGEAFVPIGGSQIVRHMGLWQDVELLERPAVAVDDLAVRTSVRENRLRVLLELRNDTDRPRSVRPLLAVEDGIHEVLHLEGGQIEIPPGGLVEHEVSGEWSGYLAWSPQTPKLYHLRVRLAGAGGLVDEYRQRFGFREVWTEGHRLLLNGRPVHLFGEWGHRWSVDSFRPEYIRQWFRMLKDGNMNYVRTHTYPHPRLLTDIADEMGILVSVEAAWHFAKEMALSDERLWQGALEHVRNIVRRDRNHPSVILYSVGNEVRYCHDVPAMVENGPRLRALYNELDPTRIAYHDGDSSLWDEREQALISRHYGTECAGEGEGWDRSRPLHVGEVGKWHFGQPHENCVWGGDEVFSSFTACNTAIALECADLAEQARANEVTCFFPWNFSGLDNWRPWSHETRHHWSDPAAPHVKPLRTAPYGSEFAWWDGDGPGYVPGVSFDILRHAFRPVAVVVRQRKNSAFSGDALAHTVTCVNDSGAAVEATLAVELLDEEGEILWQDRRPVAVEAGYTLRTELSVELPEVARAGAYTLSTTLEDRSGLLDEHLRLVRIFPRAMKTAPWQVPPVALFGGDDGHLAGLLEAHGVRVERVDSIASARVDRTPVLVVAAGAVEPGSTQNAELEAFCAAGGRALVLEQTASLFPQLQIEARPAERCHILGGAADVLEGFAPEDFEFWGDDPYGLRDSDAFVTRLPYTKPARGGARALLHSGWGDFGKGGLFWSPLVEVPVGGGVALGCQLELTARAASMPPALALLERLLEYAAGYQPLETEAVELAGEDLRDPLEDLGAAIAEPGEQSPLVIADAGGIDAEAAEALVQRVREGSTVLAVGCTVEALEAFSRALEIPIEAADLGAVYNLVRPGVQSDRTGGHETVEDVLLDGISHQETFWLERITYCPPEAVNRRITDTLIRCPAGDAVLVSEYDSCWREFFTLDARQETQRMPAATHLLFDGPRDSAAALLRLVLGEGELLLCQIPLDVEDFRPAKVFWSTMLGNLGAAFKGSVLDGEAVQSSGRSEGFPAKLRFRRDPQAGFFERVRDALRPKDLRMGNQQLYKVFSWEERESDGGRLELDESAEEVLAVFQVHPGRARKCRYEGGLPDPAQQTRLFVRGSGELELFVNDRAYRPVSLDGPDGGAEIPGIDLEPFFNSVLLRWRPGSGRSLEIDFRDNQGRAEREFLFV